MLDGKYIGFIDSDDYVSLDYIEKLLSRAFEKNADMVKCAYDWQDLNHGEKYTILYKGLSIDKGLKDEIIKLNGFLWGAVIKNELFSDFRFPEDFWYEDMITRVIIYRKCKRFEFLNEPLYKYSWHNCNLSKKVERTSNVKCLDQYFLTKKLYQLSNEIGLKDDEILYKILQNELGTMLWSRTEKKIRKQVFICACEFMNNFDYNCRVNLNQYEKYFEIAFRKYNYILWKLLSRAIRFSM